MFSDIPHSQAIFLPNIRFKLSEQLENKILGDIYNCLEKSCRIKDDSINYKQFWL